jgi:hypothetical protein
MTVPVIARHPGVTFDHVGHLPDMLSPDNPERARIQLDNGYRHGGGWQPMSGLTLDADDRLKYPGDPWLVPLAEMALRDERIVVYEHSIVAIIQPDRSFEAARMT